MWLLVNSTWSPIPNVSSFFFLPDSGPVSLRESPVLSPVKQTWWMASRIYRTIVRGRRYIPSMYMHERLHPAIPRKGIQNLVVYWACNDFWKRITRSMNSLLSTGTRVHVLVSICSLPPRRDIARQYNMSLLFRLRERPVYSRRFPHPRKRIIIKLSEHSCVPLRISI